MPRPDLPVRWTNSPLGRSLGTGLGLLDVVLALSLVRSHPGRAALEWPLTAAVLALFGVLLVVVVWTSVLSVEDGNLVASHFYGRRRLRLATVDSAEPAALFGIVVIDDEGRRMRSLVSGRAWDEFWRTRAEVICTQVMTHAAQARRDRP